MSIGTFVVASDFNKGGTWTGAIENIKHEWVNTFVWNNRKYNGNLELIKKDGIAVENIDNILITDLLNRKIKKEDQLNIFEFNDTDNTAEKVLVESENTIKENTIEYNSDDFDVYNKIIDLFLYLLREPKTVEEIAVSLNINKSQAIAWINRALCEGKINKMNKPVRYVVN
ncbi:MAG: helix-turn-helix domain-containing protein [Sedimentibacter sp.]